MYESFFNLNQAPFDNTPDPRLFYASPQHSEALAAIEYTIRLRKGAVLITGPIGAGKTTIGRTMARRCSDSATVIRVAPCTESITPLQLLRQVLRALDIKHTGREDHAVLLERLTERVHHYAEQSRPVVLLVDEAQPLCDSALEELRLIGDLDTETDKLVQLVLIGRPELRERIASPTGIALRQRIAMARVIDPLVAEETTRYIQHRLTAVSDNPQAPTVPFTDAALQRIHAHTAGVPRLINALCDNALVLAFTHGLTAIGPELIDRVQRDMIPSFAEPAFESTKTTESSRQAETSQTCAQRRSKLDKSKLSERELETTHNYDAEVEPSKRANPPKLSYTGSP